MIAPQTFVASPFRICPLNLYDVQRKTLVCFYIVILLVRKNDNNFIFDAFLGLLFIGDLLLLCIPRAQNVFSPQNIPSHS